MSLIRQLGFLLSWCLREREREREKKNKKGIKYVALHPLCPESQARIHPGDGPLGTRSFAHTLSNDPVE